MRGFCCLFLLIVGAGTPGCKPREKTANDTLIIGIENEIKNLDLRSAADANSAHVSRLILQGLVKTGDSLQTETDLAESFEVIDSKIFKFKIPTGIVFHDGTPLTSKDVLYNFQQAAGPTSKIKSSFEDVEAFEAPDDLTFIIRLKKPRPSFLASDVTAIRIFPAHLGESPIVATHPIGSGPYRFVGRHNNDLVFERFEQFKSMKDGQLQELPYFKKIIVRSIEDPTTRYLSLVGGDIDLVVNALSPRRVVEASKEGNLQVLSGPGSSYQYLGFNLRSPKFKDPRVRRALLMGTDRALIIEHKLKGYAEVATSVLPPKNTFAHPTLKPSIYNPTLAKELLKQAGVTNLEIEIRCSADRDMLSILQVIQEQWKAIGVTVKLRSTEFASFFSEVQKGNFEMFSLRWTSVTEADLLNKIFHSKETPPGRNRVFYSNPRVDALLENAASETHLQKRRDLYYKVQELIDDDTPYLPLWYPNNVAVASKRIKNFSLQATGSWMGLMKATKDSNL